jgi:AcrR family transcriptional regulator
LYYYFGSKEKLFIAVLEHTYGGFVAAHAELKLQTLPPVPALKAFVNFVWDYCYTHPEVIRLINNENLHEGRYLLQSEGRASMTPVIAVLIDILERGACTGDFRTDVDPMRFYLSVSALGYYVVSNRHTLAATLGRDFGAPDEHRQVVSQNMEMLLSYLRP